MSFGVGFGTPFGGGAPIALDSPVAEIGADEPIAFDFSDEPDGPLPGRWQFYALTHDGAGNIDGSVEPNPTSYFKVQDGLGFWRYVRQPASGSPYTERGVAASPLGILVGRNAEVAVAFVPPPDLLDGAADEFLLEVTAGLRSADDGATFVGARARAAWSGSWTTPIAFEVVSGAMADPVVLASATFDFPAALDPWEAGDLAEVRTQVRGSDLTAVLSGAQARLEVSNVFVSESSVPLVMVRVYNRRGLTFEPVPIVAGIQLRSLRDFERLGDPPILEGHEQLWAPEHQTLLRLPVRELESQGLLKQKGGRVFEVIQEFEIDEAGVKSRWPAGTRLIVTEPVQNQTLMPIRPDLARIRSAKQKASGGA